MTVGVARRLLEYADAGLPIVLLGDWRNASVPGIPHDGGRQDADGANERLRAVLSDLLARPATRMIATAAEVPAALASLGVHPDIRYAVPSTLLTMRRVDGDVDYYYLCNGKHQENAKPPVTTIDHEVTLTRGNRDSVPYLLDPWTGRASRIARYVADGDTIRLRVTLQPGQARIVALGRPGLFGDRTGRRAHATSTDADLVRYAGGRLVVRAAGAGVYTTTLSDGRTLASEIGPVPAPVELGAWHLRVEDRGPEPAVHSLRLDRLVPWSQIPGLADVSGVGTYTTTVEADGPAYLELGEVSDTCRVSVNGRRLDPVDQIHPVLDLGPHLGRGPNTIQVEVATPLGNRLRVADPAVYGGLARQPYGLVGPVRLVPYREAPIR
ncbi:hypothetical protein ACFQ0B_68760 [Nonomuraea thailandensis]